MPPKGQTPFQTERSQRKNRKHHSGRPSNPRRGIAAVEFAVVAPILTLFVFGLIEVSRIMMVKNGATYASREGARIAVTPSASSQSVTDRVKSIMDTYAATSATVVLTPATLSAAAPGDMVTVQVSVDAASISWVGNVLNLPITTIQASTTMRRESTN